MLTNYFRALGLSLLIAAPASASFADLAQDLTAGGRGAAPGAGTVDRNPEAGRDLVPGRPAAAPNVAQQRAAVEQGITRGVENLPAEDRPSPAVVGRLVDAVMRVPAGPQRDAMVRRINSVLSNPDVMFNVAAMPEDLQANAVIALGSVPPEGRERVSGFMRNNPNVARQVLNSNTSPTLQGQILTVLVSRPPMTEAQMTQFVGTLMANPAATQQLANIPNRADRDAAVATVVNVLQGAPAGSNINVGQLVKAASTAEGRAVLADLTPAQQVKYLPVLANPNIARRVATADARDKINILEVAHAVYNLPGTDSQQRNANLNALATFLQPGQGAIVSRGDYFLGALRAGGADATNLIKTFVDTVKLTPPHSQAAAITNAGKVFGDPALRNAVMALPSAKQAATARALGSMSTETRSSLSTTLGRFGSEGAASVLNLVMATPVANRDALVRNISGSSFKETALALYNHPSMANIPAGQRSDAAVRLAAGIVSSPGGVARFNKIATDPVKMAQLVGSLKTSTGQLRRQDILDIGRSLAVLSNRR